MGDEKAEANLITARQPADKQSNDQSTRALAINNLWDLFNQLNFNDKLDTGSLADNIGSIFDELLQRPKVLDYLNIIRSFDSYIFAHSINVSLMSLLAGIFLETSRDDLLSLGLGGLLHDLGQTKVNKEILYKPGALTINEYREIKRHTQMGYQLLQDFNNPPVAQIALQHHERLDGSGYPQNLKDKDIHPLTRIISITDVFDALLTDRPYREAYLPHEAAEIISSGEGHFDQFIAKVFLENISIYPVGSIVELNTGDIGIVIDVNKGKHTQPIIRLFCNHLGERITEFKEFDLSTENSIFIVKILKDDKYI